MVSWSINRHDVVALLAILISALINAEHIPTACSYVTVTSTTTNHNDNHFATRNFKRKHPSCLLWTPSTPQTTILSAQKPLSLIPTETPIVAVEEEEEEAISSSISIPKPTKKSDKALKQLAATIGDDDKEENTIIRKAEPQEIEEISNLIALCFSSSTVTDTNTKTDESNFIIQQFINDISQQILKYTVYLGMIERLFKSSFAQGFKESSRQNNETTTTTTALLGDIQELFIAETTLNHKKKMVGVVELTSSPCPIPLNNKEDPSSSPPSSSLRVAPLVCNLAIHPSYRNLGLAQSLLLTCEDYTARVHHVNEIWLETTCTNIPALKLYQKKGYICEGVDPESRGKEKRRALMRKCLGGADSSSSSSLSNPPPSLGTDILQISRNKNGEWVAVFDNDERYMVELSFVEKHFGIMAPFVAVLGAFVGVIVKY